MIMIMMRAAATTAALLLSVAAPAFAQLGDSTSQSHKAQVPDSTATTTQDQTDDTTVQKVGTALRHVSVIRQRYAQQAQSAGSPQQQQQLNQQASQDMVKAIGDQGLSVQQYDTTIRAAQSNQGLRRRLMAAAQAAD